MAISYPVWIGELEVSPIGPLAAGVSELGLVCVSFGPISQMPLKYSMRAAADHSHGAGLLAEVLHQLSAYLAGTLRDFSLPIDWRGMSAFDLRARQVCTAIPFGQVITYAELARRAGSPKASRAAGSAMARNPMPLVIPCHRVVGSDFGLHGYAGPEGIQTKAWLLRLEGQTIAKNNRIILDSCGQERLF